MSAASRLDPIRRIRFLPIALLLLGVSAFWAFPASAEEAYPQEIDRCPFSGRFPVEIRTETPFAFRALLSWDLDIDDARPGIVEAYVDDAQLAELRSAGYEVQAIPNQARRAWAAQSREEPGREAYHTYATLTTELAQIHADYPAITQLFSIGTSVQGRELWMLKISDNAAVDEPEPEFKYSAAIHGDEVTGIEMCVYFIRLLVQNYGSDPQITSLVDDLEIYICPLHNPDGRENGTRYNANGDDLNRSFPDPRTDPIDSPSGRPPEVAHMMNFQTPHNFVLGANYHGGALVMNYPWDTWNGQYTPDDDTFVEICLGYSSRNLPMWNSSSFYHGITIGWDWYVIDGGMQDWAYNWRNELHVTIEMSNTKWPPATSLPGLWEDNRAAMLYFIEQTRIGVEGFVTDAANGDPLKATIETLEIGKNIRSEPQDGFYHRMLLPGTYTLRFSAPGYITNTQTGVVVVAGTTTHLNVPLTRDAAAWSTVSGTVTEAETATPLAATVTAYLGESSEVFAAMETNPANGGYALEVPNGNCRFVASADGHAPVSATRTVSDDLDLDFALPVVQAQVLLVHDNDTTSRFAADLSALACYVVEETNWTTDPATWAEYDLLVWSAGSHGNPVADATLRAALESYVAAGHKLLIEGGELGYDALISPRYVTFAANVLHVTAYHIDNAGALEVRPVQTGHPMVTHPNALPASIAITYSVYGDQDAVTPRPEATLLYGTHSYPNDAGILIYDPSGTEAQIAYYPFNYDALTSADTGRQLLENTLEYLLYGSPQSLTDEHEAGYLSLTRPAPTPTRGATTFRLALASPSAVELGVFDATGRQVRSLFDGLLDAGAHALAWDGRDANGHEVAPGVYFVRAVSAHGSAGERVVVVR